MDGEHHQNNDSSIVLRSTVPFIEIDSLFIDLTSCIEKPNAADCDHFSIRGYASQMREKDWKKCWPFNLDDDCKPEETTSLLPPFHVPDFRWWRCQNCRKETPAGFEQPSNVDMIDGRVAVANTSMNLCNVNHPPSFSIEKENAAEGHEVDSRQILNPEIPLSISVIPEVKSSLLLERDKSDPEQRESIKNSELVCGNEVAEVELGLRNLKVIDENPEVFDEGKQTPPHKEQMQKTLLAVGGKVINQVCTNGESDPANTCPAKLDESNATTSEYTEISVENDVQDYHTDKSGSLHRRKTRKVRLLTELLNENGNTNTKHLETEETPSDHEAPEKAEGLKELSGPQYPMSVKKSIRSSGQNMRSKLPVDEDCIPPEVSSSYKINSKSQALKGDVGTTDAVHAIESDNALSETVLQTKKSFMNKCRIDSRSIHGKKKNKKTQLEACSSKTIPPDSGNNMSDVSFKHEEFLTGAVDPFLLFGSRIEPNSSMSKKKSKRPTMDEGHNFTWNSGMARRDSVALKEVEIRNSQPVAVPCPSELDESSERVHLSLNSYLATPRIDKKSVPQAEDGSHCLSYWRGSTSTASGFTNKDAETNNLKDSDVSFNRSDNFPGQRTHSGLNSKMAPCRMHFLNEKRNSNPQAEDDFWSQLQPMDNAGVNRGEKSTTVQEHLASKMQQGDQMVGKASEQRTLDDIPMEIVELMAKNQYERCLDNTENNKPLSKTSSRKAQIMDFSNACGTSGLLQEKLSHKWEAHERNGRNNIFTAGDSVGYEKLSSGDYFSHTERGHFNMNHVHQTLIPPEHSAFAQTQNKSSNGVKFLASGTSESVQYRKYTGSMVDQESSHSRVQAFGRCNTQMSLSQKNVVAGNLWSETRPNQHSYVSTTSKKVAAQSTIINVRDKYPESSSRGVMNREHDRKFFNLNAANLEKDDSNYGFDNFSRASAKRPFACHSNGIELPQNLMGSLDLYSNETIPAMHLLSLMDAGMQRNETRGTQNFPKKPSSHDLKAKEISRQDIDLHKTFDSINYSSDYYGEIHPSKKPRDSFCPTSVAGASISPFIRNENFDIAADLMCKVVQQSEQKELTKCSSLTWNRGQKAQKSVFASGVLGSNKGVFPIHSLQKKSGGASSSLVAISGYDRMDSRGLCVIEPQSTKRLLEHSKISSEFGICSINKNPAEFSIPEVGNVYMIGAEDIKFSKRSSPEKISGLITVDRRKRKRNVKHTSLVKERALPCNF